jgi:demethylmenaquinone methyltransferase/2-methoxy-6-polyprenyl-1,4-benzoquinol methylase
MFAAIAPRYDLANRLLSAGMDRRWRRVTARCLAPGRGQLALDVACGTGDLALALTGKGGRVVGVDFTHPMLLRAAARDGRRRRLLLAGADALALPFPDGTFHRVTVAFGIRNYADLPAGLAEMFRVSRPGGRLGILEFSRPDGILAPLVRPYVNGVMPRLGRWISGRTGPYDYLADSIRTWPTPRELAGLLSDAGFREVTWRRFFAGIATLHLGRRQS